MTDALAIANHYIATWNATDEERRAALIAVGWTKAASYVDPLMAAEGHEAIGAIIGAVHAQFPGFVFTLEGKPDGFGDNVRFSWGLGPKDQDPLIEGTDFVRTDGRLIAAVTGFLDKVPAAA